MKFVEIIFIILCINLTVTLFAQSHIFPASKNFVGTSLEGNFDQNTGEGLDPNTMSYKIVHFTENKSYLNPGVQDPNAKQILLSGDFIRVFFWFTDTMAGGTFLVWPTLQQFGVPAGVAYYFVVPVFFMYAIAIFQLLSGRSFSLSQ